MTAKSQYLIISAVCAIFSALTTTILMYGPSAAIPEAFEATQALHSNTLHTYKNWILFFHPQFAFIAALGAAAILYNKAPAYTAIGIFYLAVWALTEMTQQAYLIDALNQIWRPAYLAADAADKAQWRTIIEGLAGITDTLYFVLIYGFGLGSLVFGLAFLKQGDFAQVIGALTSLIGFMSLVAFTYYYAGAAPLGNIIHGWYDWIYGPLQIGVRLALGIWLWRQATLYKRPDPL